MSPSPPSRATEDTSADALIEELLDHLGSSFNLSTPIGARTLGGVVEQRLRSLDLQAAPNWGSLGKPSQVARESSPGLDFYYRPHLFPGMDPALRLGHHLQFDLLPRQLAQQSPLRVAAVLESYCHLSGDLLGWRWEGDSLFLWIADVSGHGVRSGLAAAVLFFLVEQLEPGLPPAQVAQRLNEGLLAARNPQDPGAVFATAVWMRADDHGHVDYASSGHDPVLIRRRDGEIESLGSTGLPLGLLPDQSFAQGHFDLRPGDLVCLYTDGLVEARDPQGVEFGRQNVGALLGHPDPSPMDVVRRLYTAVGEHRTTSLLDDDLTFLVFESAAE